jgi:hypothetical protein
MISANYPALFAALLALGACAKSDEGSTDTDTAGQTSTASTTATTPATTGGSTGAEGSSGEATTHATHGGTTTSATTSGEPTTTATTSEPSTGELTTGGEALSCDAYCATISANCTGANAQYGSAETCLATCADIPPGAPADTGGNTLGCRTYHAGAAAGMPDVHCRHAGPGGDGVCGDNCESFCTIAAAACPDAWPDDAACQTACGTFSPDETYDATDVAGNTFACRLYHLTAAALDPATHCAHIKGDSAPCK